MWRLLRTRRLFRAGCSNRGRRFPPAKARRRSSPMSSPIRSNRLLSLTPGKPRRRLRKRQSRTFCCPPLVTIVPSTWITLSRRAAMPETPSASTSIRPVEDTITRARSSTAMPAPPPMSPPALLSGESDIVPLSRIVASSPASMPLRTVPVIGKGGIFADHQGQAIARPDRRTAFAGADDVSIDVQLRVVQDADPVILRLDLGADPGGDLRAVSQPDADVAVRGADCGPGLTHVDRHANAHGIAHAGGVVATCGRANDNGAVRRVVVGTGGQRGTRRERREGRGKGQGRHGANDRRTASRYCIRQKMTPATKLDPTPAGLSSKPTDGPLHRRSGVASANI